jgi:ATP-dependent Clp protease ATP-binding subunit ClpC
MVVDLAKTEANRLGDNIFQPSISFARSFREEHPAGSFTGRVQSTRQNVYENVLNCAGAKKSTGRKFESRYKTLEKYSRNLTQAAKEGKLDPVFGS